MAADVYVTFGGSSEGLEATLASAKASVNAYAAELRNLAKELVATGQSADSELGGRMQEVAGHLSEAKGAVSELKSELKGVGDSSEGVGGIAGFFEEIGRSAKSVLEPIHSMSSSIGEIAEAALAAFAVEKVSEFIKSMGELGEQTERTGAQLGLTPKQVGELNYQFAVTGTNVENVVRTMARFEAALPAARDGTGNVAEGLRALGLTAQDLIGLSLPEQLAKIADATSRFADGPTKTAALQELGRGFVELLPLLDKGSAGLRKFADEADHTNSLLDKATMEALVAMNRSFVELGATIDGVKGNAFTPFINVVTSGATIISDFAKTLGESAKEGGSLRDVLNAIAAALKAVETAAALAKSGFVEIDAIITGSLKILQDFATGAGKVLAPNVDESGALTSFRLDQQQQVAASKDTAKQIAADFSSMWAKIWGQGNQTADEWLKIWGAASSEGGEKAEAAAAKAAKTYGTITGAAPAAAADPAVIAALNAQIGTVDIALQGLGVNVQKASAGKAASIELPEGISDQNREEAEKIIAARERLVESLNAEASKKPAVPSMDTGELGKLNTQIDATTAALKALGVTFGETGQRASQWPPSNVTFGNAGPFSAHTSANDALAPDLKAAMERLSQQFGSYTVTSTTEGGHAPGSYHYKGEAVDVSTQGMSDEKYAELIVSAIKSGFTGIGISDTHAHFDMRGGAGAQAQVFPDQPGGAGTAVHGHTPEEWAAALASTQAPSQSGGGAASAPTGAPVIPSGLGPEQLADVQQLVGVLEQARTKIQEIQDKQAGGNALQQQQLSLEQQSTQQKQSAVVSLQAEFTAASQVVADDERRGIVGEKLTKDLQEQAKLKTQLREATEAAAESELKLGVAASKNSGTAQQQFDAAKKLADYKISVAGADVAAQNAAKTELLAAETTYQNAVRAQIMQTQQMAIASAQETAKSDIDKLNERLKTHALTMAEWLTQATSVYEKEKTAVTAAYQAEIQAAGNKTQEVERLANEEQKTIAAISLQEQQAQSKAAEQAAANWQSAMSSINSAFDAQIDGLLTGTKSWQQAFKDVLKSLTEDLIKFGLNKALTLGENSIGGLFGFGPGPGAAASGLGGLGGIFGGGTANAAGGAVSAATTAAQTANTSALVANTGVTTAHAAATTGQTAATTGQTLATTTNTVTTGGNTVTTAASTVGNTGNTVATATNTATQSTGIGAWIANTVATAANTVAEDANSIGKLFGFAEGTPMVKQTGVAMIHAGEAVIPAAMNPFKNLNVSLSSFTGDAVERARAGMAMIFHAPKLPAFDGGAWELPHDMVAGLHAGETVLPAKSGLASGFREFAANGGFGGGAGGGGGNSVAINPAIHLHNNNIDSAGVQSFYRNNERDMMKAVNQAVRSGAHLGLRRLTSLGNG